MAFYEHTFIGKQDLSNKEVENLVTKYSDLINKSGKILKTENWGLLNLASKIKKNRKGIFIHFKIETKEESSLKEFEKKLSIDNNVLRYLTVKYNKLDLEKEYFRITK
ncbi:MAG: 30S ribosomal protein S6 [Candidatus Pelagibacter sp.]|nr:30S ribosomal protein S6 [Candidatus Pelagibacter sp.]|tara:strand:- start:12035 stop:12358 length:324 start_codon:yes stop_codon:yes gene_type:complete